MPQWCGMVIPKGKRRYAMGILNTVVNSRSYFNYHPADNQFKFDKNEIPLTELFVDPGSAKTGYGRLEEGNQPQWTWDVKIGQAGPKPSDKHRRGFFIKVCVPNRGWADWTSVSTGVLIGFDKIFDDIWKQKNQYPGQIAHLKYCGSKAIRIGKGGTRQPMFELIGWVARHTLPEDQSLGGSNFISPRADIVAVTTETAMNGGNLPF